MPSSPPGQPSSYQPPPVLVDQLDIVVGSARGAVTAFLRIRFLWPPQAGPPELWPRVGVVRPSFYRLSSVVAMSSLRLGDLVVSDVVGDEVTEPNL